MTGRHNLTLGAEGRRAGRAAADELSSAAVTCGLAQFEVCRQVAQRNKLDSQQFTVTCL